MCSGEGYMKMEAETGVMHLHAQDHKRPPGARGGGI